MATIHETTFLAAGSHVIGDVTIGSDCGVWYNAVIRGDSDKIEIGNNTNVQDNCVLHVDINHPLKVGDNVTIGHGAIVHGCTVGNNVLIGMVAIILNDAVIGDNCIIGAGALVTQGKEIPAGSMVYGNPAKIAREVTEEEIASILKNAKHYVEEAHEAKMAQEK